jgi:hypothetical protein
MPTYAPAGSTFTLTDPVSCDEIGRRLKVRPQTPHQWRKRGVLPPALFTVSGIPVWDWAMIESWARDTGRLRAEVPKPEPIDRYPASVLLTGAWH